MKWLAAFCLAAIVIILILVLNGCAGSFQLKIADGAFVLDYEEQVHPAVGSHDWMRQEVNQNEWMGSRSGSCPGNPGRSGEHLCDDGEGQTSATAPGENVQAPLPVGDARHESSGLEPDPGDWSQSWDSEFGPDGSDSAWEPDGESSLDREGS